MVQWPRSQERNQDTGLPSQNFHLLDLHDYQTIHTGHVTQSGPTRLNSKNLGEYWPQKTFFTRQKRAKKSYREGGPVQEGRVFCFPFVLHFDHL